MTQVRTKVGGQQPMASPLSDRPRALALSMVPAVPAVSVLPAVPIVSVVTVVPVVLFKTGTPRFPRFRQTKPKNNTSDHSGSCGKQIRVENGRSYRAATTGRRQLRKKFSDVCLFCAERCSHLLN